MWSIARRCTLIVITLIFSSCAYDESPTDPGAHASWSVDADAMASTVVVTSVADDGSPGTLREAIATAPAGATITFDPSLAGATIVLQSQPTPFGGALHVGLDLTIEGPSPQGVTIDANQTGPVFRVLTNCKLTLRDLTVTGGETATLDGGGIIAEGDVELERVHVTGNATGASGGGIYAYANLHLTNSMVSGNESFGRGGGIRMAPLSGDLVIIESTIHDNMATDATGGGIYSEAASTLVERSTISENLSNLAGGGIVVHEANGVIRNSTISGNMASRFEGGGLLVELGTVNLSHTTVVGNRAGRNGAGIFLGTDASVAAHNTVFYDNQAGGLFESCWGGTPTFTGWNTNNDLSCGAGSGLLGIVDPLLGPLADNGGPTQTHAVERGSPLIDLTQDCPLSVDQRGVARPMGPRCESGAFEFDDYAAVAYTIDPSGTANRNDGTAVVSGTATCEVSAHVTIVVTVTQKQKVRRLNTEVSGSSTDTFFCSAQTHAWAVAVKPSPGGFVNAPVEVTVRTTVAPAYFERPTVAEPSVKLAWSRK